MHKSQRQRVIDQLKATGFVSRNWCLSQFPSITRLSALALTLQKEGWEFAPRRENGDYEYHVVKVPTKTIRTAVERDGKWYPTTVEVPVV